MSTSTLSNNGISMTALPLRQRSFGRYALILAWLAFWLNTALIPCCEAFAATPDDHADVLAQSVSASAHMHDSHAAAAAADTEQKHHTPTSPCEPTHNAEPVTNGSSAVPTVDRADFSFGVTNTYVVASHISANQSANLSFNDYHPPPPRPSAGFRLYLQTQRLLI